MSWKKEQSNRVIFSFSYIAKKRLHDMKTTILIPVFIFCFLGLNSCGEKSESWIRINQMGYRTNDPKIAVFLSTKKTRLNSFKIIDISNGNEIETEKSLIKADPLPPFLAAYRLKFSELKKEGKYRIIAGKSVSPDFTIGDNIYDNTADYLLNYMRQQRCGFNPYRNASCHLHDGYEIYGPENDSVHIDVTGGWHDAADYLQYVATSANATYQMLFSWQKNPEAFNDNYLADGLPGSDGVPDILNEIRWGLDWLVKMNPSDRVMYNQIADDRDHVGFRYPDEDKADYGKGPERPVYRCTGKPQGLFGYLNRTTGIASTAGKFASAFALGARMLREIDPELSRLLTNKAVSAFKYGLENPGACQTAPGKAPYFYEEDNWTDDMELAAAELFNLTKKPEYLDYAVYFGRQEKITPWMGADTARHYQWYPFVNMGHPLILYAHSNDSVRKEFAEYMKQGILKVKERGRNNPFLMGIPFIWCSNNLVTAFLTHLQLYSSITGDNSFDELEAACRDWLFGCNPWGTSMIVGLPATGDYPENTHSSYVVKGGQVFGGLVDGPVYPSIFNSLRGLYLSAEDEYAQFQNKLAVYHDDFADYSTNECTMDGTACLIYYLSSLQNTGKRK